MRDKDRAIHVLIVHITWHVLVYEQDTACPHKVLLEFHETKYTVEIYGAMSLPNVHFLC